MPDDDFIVNVKQIVQYPRKTVAAKTDFVLTQDNSVGAGPYSSMSVSDLVSTALQLGGALNLEPGANIAWNGAALTWNAGLFTFTEPVTAPNLLIGTDQVATQKWVAAQIPASVTSFNGRTGDVQLLDVDVLRAGGAPVWNPHFGGMVTAPTPWNPAANSDQVATTAWVWQALMFWSQNNSVASFNGRTGPITLTIADINAAYGVSSLYPAAPNPPLGDASNRIATTLFVDDTVADFITQQQLTADLSAYALLNSPAFIGVPTGPTASTGTATGQLATTAFVMAAIIASTTGVASFNTRTGAVTLQSADITGAGGALLVSPALTGTPTAPTATAGTSNTQLATTAFVTNALSSLPSGGVSSFNTRTGAVTLTLADVTATNVLQNTPLIGTPTAPTAAPGTSTTQLATTAFVQAAVAAIPPGGVTSFNTRTGAVTLTGADVSAAGGALNVSPTFTGTPAAPTAAPGTNTTQIATTAFVTAAIAAAHTSAGISVNIRVFTASGTYAPSAGLLSAVVRCIGGGGGGASGNFTSGYTLAGGGGGGGGLSDKALTAAQIGASQPITIGAGGIGGAAGPNNGTAGGATSFGTLCIANGGLGGINPSVSNLGGAGGGITGAVGDVVVGGAPGEKGVWGSSSYMQQGGGAGGSTFGGGAIGQFGTPLPGLPGVSYGGGGSGASSYNTGSGAAGGNGAPGVVIVTEYISTTAVTATALTDAPSDGTVYGRENGSWTPALQHDKTANMTAGLTFTAFNAGSPTGFTPDPTQGNYQYLTVAGAFVLNTPTSDCAIDILMTYSSGNWSNGPGWVLGSNAGDPWAPVAGNRFLLSIRRIAGISTYFLKALQ